MMPAAKMMDPLLGLDIHMIQPPGPVPPLPIPHPFVGMLFDPMDLIPFVGATILVNGMPRGIAGTAAKAVPPHIPMGGVFVPPPPGNEGEMFMGSATVQMDGDPASYLALPALSCQTIGMPAPFRMNPKKKTKMKSLQLPLSVVLPIPMGLPVLVGGPPTISMMGMLQKLGMAALGKAFAKLKRVMKGSKKAKALSDKIHKAAKKAMTKLGVPPSVQKSVHKAICSVTGHPVDIASGKVFTDCVDFEVPGSVPLGWERTWDSASTYSGPLGHGWHHAYDLALLSEGSVIAVRLEDGRACAFPVLAMGESHFSRQDKLTLKRESYGYLMKKRGGLSYHFAAAPGPRGENPLLGVSDGLGHYVRFSYDNLGRLKAIKDSGDRIFTVHNDEMGRIIEIRAPHPETAGAFFPIVTYAYNAFGDMVEARDALRNPWRYEYRNHLLTKETDRNGLSFHFEYDGPTNGARCVRTYGDGGIYDHKLKYDPVIGVTEVTNSLGAKSLHYHDGAVVWKTVDALGRVEFSERNEFYEMTAFVNALGDRTEVVFDEMGNMVEVIAADGTKQKASHDPEGHVLTAVDEIGGEWKWVYDPAGNLVERVNPVGASTRYLYENGHLVSMTDPLELETGILYDDRGNIAGIRMPDGHIQRWSYDRLGRPVRSIDVVEKTQIREWDLGGRLVKVIEEDGNVTHLVHDNEGNILHLRNANHDIRFSFAGMGRLATRTENGTTVHFDYDTEERLTGIRNEHGSVYGFVLDAAGGIVEETGFDGIGRKLTLDPAGRVVKMERPGGLLSEFEYDPRHRLVKRSHSDGSGETFRWRADGEMLEAANQESKIKFDLDPVGRILKEIQGKDWVASEYDAGGRRIGISSSRGLEQRIKRNAMGDAIGIEAGKPGFGKPDAGQDRGAETYSVLFSATFKFDAVGLELERSLPGGISARWERDKMGRPLRREVLVDGALKTSKKYVWNPGGQLKLIVDSLKGSTKYSHDAFGNLASAIYEDGKVDVRLPDAVGNLFRDGNRADRKYGPSGQLLESTGPKGLTRYEYDSLGNLVRKIGQGNREWAYAWSGAGTLAKVIRPDGSAVEFRYDPFGRRTSKSSDGRIRRWVWDDDVPLHEWEEKAPVAAKPVAKPDAKPGEGASAAAQKEREAVLSGTGSQAPPPPGEGTPTAPVTWLFDPESFAPMAKLVGDHVYSILTDQIGAPTSMHDATGKLVWSAEIGIYGDLRQIIGTKRACPFRWPGQYEDEETGLYYNRYRYYDPDSGEYLSQDPLGTDVSLRLYGYVNDPLTFADVLGLAKGGSHWKVRDSNTGGEVHHMPANSVSPHTTGTGPAIHMSDADHAKTASHGSSTEAKAYRAEQKALIDDGKFAKAMENDIEDLAEKKMLKKYNKNVEEMLEYSAKKGFISRRDANRLKKKYCS
ncbi:MAG: DUF6531 domain-containing protein [Fibrobacteria bacterium]